MWLVVLCVLYIYYMTAESNVILNMWDTVENFPDTIYPIIIRTFGGGESSFQTQELKHALGNLDIHRYG